MLLVDQLAQGSKVPGGLGVQATAKPGEVVFSH